MSNFVLVHGSWHGAWCWYKIVPRLRALGHEVEAIDLPGHGRDRTPLEGITLDSYVERIHEAIDRFSEPVVLVAHSRGGIAGTQAAEGRHERIGALVYLGAYMLRDGESILDVVQHDPDSLVLRNLEFAPDGHWDMLRQEAFEPGLYAHCPPEDVVLAHALLTPEPSQPAQTPMSISEERYGSIPRTYIELLDDKAVTPGFQRRMYEAAPCEVRSITTDHSPYFSAPDELTAHLDEIATASAKLKAS